MSTIQKKNQKTKITITIRNHQKRIPINPKITQKIKRAVLKALSLERKKILGEINFCLVNNQEIVKINKKFLNKSLPTDVIAFNYTPESRRPLKVTADIAISTDTACSNAKIFKTSPVYELFLYALHGVLHAIGYNDRTKKEKIQMHRKAELILSKSGINKPK